MPSPIGHALAGVAVALASERQSLSDRPWRFLTRPLTLWCLALAMVPDADLLLRGFHRTATHSIVATILVTIVAIVVTGWVTRSRQSAVASPQSPVGSQQSADASRQSPHGSQQSAVGSPQSLIAWRVVLVCAAAHASHLLTDWLGTDRSTPAGIQLLWPFSDRWFISAWNLFPQIERRQMFSLASIAINLKALVWEVGLVGPIVLALWWLRGRPRSTQSTQSSQRTHWFG